MTTEREAFDLWYPACRKNFYKELKRGSWRRWWWVRLVAQDTFNRVCSKKRNGI